MNRERFDHVVRAAAGVLGESELLLIGSQAEHASVSEPLPEEAERSVEVDIVPLDDPDGSKADRVDGSIGEASMFHESLGVYARGAGETTAVVPDGWRDRLVRYTEPASGVVAWCLELHDLWVAKAIAGRPKDREFCDALLDAGLVDAVTFGLESRKPHERPTFKRPAPSRGSTALITRRSWVKQLRLLKPALTKDGSLSLVEPHGHLQHLDADPRQLSREAEGDARRPGARPGLDGAGRASPQRRGT